MASTYSTPKKRDWKSAFLLALEESSNVAWAARKVGIDRTTPYAARESDPEFAAAWDSSLEVGIGELEHEAFRRAKDISDTLLIFLLKCHKPHVYRDRQDVTMDLNLKVVVEHRERPALPEPLPGVVIESQ